MLFFCVNPDGIVVFYYRGETYAGTWVLFFFEDKLQININLNTEKVVGEDWNFDWKVNLITNQLIDFEIDEDTRFILQKECLEEN